MRKEDNSLLAQKLCSVVAAKIVYFAEARGQVQICLPDVKGLPAEEA